MTDAETLARLRLLVGLTDAIEIQISATSIDVAAAILGQPGSVHVSGSRAGGPGDIIEALLVTVVELEAAKAPPDDHWREGEEDGYVNGERKPP